MFKSCGVGLLDFSVGPSPLVTIWVFEHIRTWLGFGLGFFGTKGLGPGLDNNASFRHCCTSWEMSCEKKDGVLDKQMLLRAAM